MRSPLSFIVAVSFLALLLLAHSSEASDELENYFFRRNAKWISLAPSGGSLVSGRGNFRPGFNGRGGSAMYMNDPILAFKRSYPMEYHQ